MASSLKSLSDNETNSSIPSGLGLRIAIVVSEWNWEVCGKLLEGAKLLLEKHHTSNIIVFKVPGSFEHTLGAQQIIEKSIERHTSVDAVICLGCVIQGETRHFDFICSAVANGLTQVQLKYNIPVVFGVLTPDNLQQALDRAGGKHGNKGDEAAATALKMCHLKKQIEREF